MKDHSHPEPKKCQHDLGWCEKCERPYCKTCGQEWYAQTFNIPSIWYKDTSTTKPIVWPDYYEQTPRFQPLGPAQAPPQRFDVYCESHGTKKG